jgi:predicted phosphodiesterase
MSAFRCIQYLSDLHIEFYKGSLPKVDRLLRQIVPIAPLCILAGDIGYPFEETYRYFLEGMSRKFEHVILIHGNHEYYQNGKNKGKTMEEIVEQTRAVCVDLPRVHFLHNETWDYFDVRFIGSVLWSELKDPQRLINDSRLIGEFSLPLWNELHYAHKEWLDGALNSAEDQGKRAVVITHHLPSMSLIAEKWKHLGDFNQCFASTCDDLIRPPAIFWIYGHTHEPANTVLQGVQCVANPIGYPGENPKPNYNAFLPLP